jgi:hypothetical protein
MHRVKNSRGKVKSDWSPRNGKIPTSYTGLGDSSVLISQCAGPIEFLRHSIRTSKASVIGP